MCGLLDVDRPRWWGLPHLFPRLLPPPPPPSPFAELYPLQACAAGETVSYMPSLMKCAASCTLGQAGWLSWNSGQAFGAIGTAV